ncbi:MAG: DUF4190 domain-containing protein [Lachnospiraceae bacterium]|nr:DUF4190 domain-containing protein [Lachnospiraceae bacterium]
MDYNNQNQNSNQQTNGGQYSNMYSQQNAGQYSQQQTDQPQFGQQQPHYSSQQGKYSDPYSYQPQGQFNSPYNAPVQAPGPNGFQITSLVLGIMSILCCFCIWLWFWGIPSIVLSIAGIIFGIVGNKKNKHGVGTAGIVCSIIGIVLGIIMLVFTIFVVGLATSMNLEDLLYWLQQYEGR